jgi:uncharacterized Zn-binding protein involved in type VI secretion
MTMPAAQITSLTMHGGQVTTGTPRVLIGARAAARLRDMHTCPLFTLVVPHGGGVVTWGSIAVWSGGLPQARMADACACTGPNTVALGHLTTLVGEGSGLSGASIAALLAFLAEVSKANQGEGPPYPYARLREDGKVVTEYSKSITIEGNPEYQAKVLACLDTMADTKAGQRQLGRIERSGRHVTICPWGSGDSDNHCQYDYDDKEDPYYHHGGPGDGSDSTIFFDPDRNQQGDGSQPWQQRPPDVGLFHELHHAADAATGELELGQQGVDGQATDNSEAQAVGVGTHANDPYTENEYRKERGLPPRPTA